MIDPFRTRHVLRSLLLQAGQLAGDGSWEQQVETEYTPDGRTLLVIAAVPLRHPMPLAPPPKNHTSERDHLGRPTEVPRDLARWLADHPGSHHADIMDAMTAMGHSRSAANTNLKVLVKLGWVSHAAKGQPYYWKGAENVNTKAL